MINICILEWGWCIYYEIYVDEIVVRYMIEYGNMKWYGIELEWSIEYKWCYIYE